jgi:hypothetical protein
VKNALAYVHAIYRCTLQKEINGIRLLRDQNVAIIIFTRTSVLLRRIWPPFGLGHHFPSREQEYWNRLPLFVTIYSPHRQPLGISSIFFAPSPKSAVIRLIGLWVSHLELVLLPSRCGSYQDYAEQGGRDLQHSLLRVYHCSLPRYTRPMPLRPLANVQDQHCIRVEIAILPDWDCTTGPPLSSSIYDELMVLDSR